MPTILPAPVLAGWLTHRFSWTISEFEIDMLEHLNNVAAMELFERARWDMLNARGYGQETVRRTNCAPVIVSVRVDYARELRLRQTIDIETYVSAEGGKVNMITQVMRDAEGAVCVVAAYTIGLFDLTTRRLIAPSAAWRAACGAPDVGA